MLNKRITWFFCSVGLPLLLSCVSGEQYCTSDGDCAALGNLHCIKSMCEWGICACPRGKVARFLGSETGFKCAKLVKVGGKCNEENLCGAENSACSGGVCVCTDPASQEPRFGGEVCLDKQQVYSTETCGVSVWMNVSPDSHSCQTGQWWDGYDDEPIAGLPDHPLDYVPNVVLCADGKHTELVNNFDSSVFVGSKIPACVDTKIGDTCLTKLDCQNIQYADGGPNWASDGAVCSDNVCQCVDPTHVPDITGLYCAIPLSYGATCATDNTAEAPNVGVCDGTLGMRCGNPCEADMLQVAAATRDLTCVCDTSYFTSGVTCIARQVGDSCYGDFNCKAISRDAVCTDGYCSGAAAILGSFVTLALTILTTLQVGINM